MPARKIVLHLSRRLNRSFWTLNGMVWRLRQVQKALNVKSDACNQGQSSYAPVGVFTAAIEGLNRAKDTLTVLPWMIQQISRLIT